MIKEQIREQLKQMADEDYKKFSKKIVPGVDNMFGIRLPKLRETAKKIAKEDADGYLQQLEEVLSSGGEVYYEEIMLYGLVIGYARWDDEKRTMWLERFMKYIDNWAVCDSCCMTYKWMKKDPEYWWAYLIRQIKKNREYTIRFAFVCMLAHFVDEDHVEEILSWCERIRHEGYYVKMAAAWAVSVCYVKYPEITDPFLQQNRLDDDTQNKAIRKICDSYRVTKEQKQQVKTYKKS